MPQPLPRTFAKKKKKRRIQKLAILSAILVFFLVVVLVCFNLKTFIVSDIKIQGEFDDAPMVMAHAEKILHETYFHIIPKGSIFFVPVHTIKDSLEKEFPEEKEFNVSLIGRTVVVTPVLRVPKILWCGITAPEPDALLSECFFADENGKIYAPASHFDGTMIPRYTGALTAAEPLGATFLTRPLFSAVTVFVDGLRNMGLHPQYVSVDSNFDVIIQLREKYALYVKAGPTLPKVLQYVERTLHDPTLTPFLSSSRMLYLDFRFQGRLFYRLKDEV